MPTGCRAFAWAIRPPAGVRVEAGVYWELLGRSGLVKPRRVLDEVAARDSVLCGRGRRRSGRWVFDLKAAEPAAGKV